MPQQKKKVYKFDAKGKLLAEYASTLDAAKANNTVAAKISANCNGHQASALGFIFSFENQIKIDSKRKIKNSANVAECPICNNRLKITKDKETGKFILKK